MITSILEIFMKSIPSMSSMSSETKSSPPDPLNKLVTLKMVNMKIDYVFRVFFCFTQESVD